MMHGNTLIATISTLASPSVTAAWSLVSGILKYIDSRNFYHHHISSRAFQCYHPSSRIPSITYNSYTSKCYYLHTLVLTNQKLWSYEAPTSPCKIEMCMFLRTAYCSQQNTCHKGSADSGSSALMNSIWQWQRRHLLTLTYVRQRHVLSRIDSRTLCY